MISFDVNFNYNYQSKQSEIIFNKETVESFYNKKQEVYECKDGETIFIITRHGENESNVAGTYDGRTLNLPIYWHLTQDLGFFVPYENFKPDNGAYMIVSIKNGEMTLLETDDINIIP